MLLLTLFLVSLTGLTSLLIGFQDVHGRGPKEVCKGGELHLYHLEFRDGYTLDDVERIDFVYIGRDPGDTRPHKVLANFTRDGLGDWTLEVGEHYKGRVKRLTTGPGFPERGPGIAVLEMELDESGGYDTYVNMTDGERQAFLDLVQVKECKMHTKGKPTVVCKGDPLLLDRPTRDEFNQDEIQSVDYVYLGTSPDDKRPPKIIANLSRDENGDWFMTPGANYWSKLRRLARLGKKSPAIYVWPDLGESGGYDTYIHMKDGETQVYLDLVYVRDGLCLAL